jgi:hypothetical protein
MPPAVPPPLEHDAWDAPHPKAAVAGPPARTAGFDLIADHRFPQRRRQPMPHKRPSTAAQGRSARWVADLRQPRDERVGRADSGYSPTHAQDRRDFDPESRRSRMPGRRFITVSSMLHPSARVAPVLVFSRLLLHEDGMHRRRFIALLGTTITAARTLRAQQKATAVIGYLSVFSPPANPADLARGSVRQGLSETGFIEGRNMVTEYRWAEGQYDRLPALAADLVDRKVDVIVTLGGTPPALAAKNATSTIPIVFTAAGDPVGFGLVASLARPGGNVTGFSNFSIELMPKRLEFLCFRQLSGFAKYPSRCLLG